MTKSEDRQYPNYRRDYEQHKQFSDISELTFETNLSYTTCKVLYDHNDHDMDKTCTMIDKYG